MRLIMHNLTMVLFVRYGSTHEVGDFDSKTKTGGVVASEVGPDGSLKKISSATAPESPVSSELSPDGKLLIVAC